MEQPFNQTPSDSVLDRFSKNKKTFFIIAGVVIAVIIIAAVIYIYLKKKAEPPEKVISQQQIIISEQLKESDALRSQTNLRPVTGGEIKNQLKELEQLNTQLKKPAASLSEAKPSQQLEELDNLRQLSQ